MLATQLKSLMPEKFDPYYEWLDIAPAEQPADYYRLLGLEIFEEDKEVIRDHADERMAKVRTHQHGKHSRSSQRILNELSAAKHCLLDKKLRPIYDTKLKKILEENKLPTLAVPTDLLPPELMPQNYDPFYGTADVDEEYDPLEPVPEKVIWPFVLGGLLVVLIFAAIVVAANLAR